MVKTTNGKPSATVTAGGASSSRQLSRRAASVEFYVNGVLKGTSATVPDSGLWFLYDVYLTNGSGTHDVRADITFFTVGTPMF